jgi:predicted transcriptional regulator
MPKYNVTSNWVPDIKEFRNFVNTIDGLNIKILKRFSDQIDESTGTPQEPMDWKDPDKWIERFYRDKVLDEKTREIAEEILKSGLNPRYWNYEKSRLAFRHGLIEKKSGRYFTTEKGKKFADGDEQAITEYLFENGILKVLEFLNEETGASRQELIEKWKNWINTEVGRHVKAQSVLLEGVVSRIDNVLIPLKLVRKEGIPRRYFITEKGVKRIEELKIEETPGKKGEKRHQIAIDNILDIGKNLGYQVQPHPKLRDLFPREKRVTITESIYDKELDGIWKTNLPLIGEIRIPIEVQYKGSVTDLLSRLKIIAPYSHFMIVVSDNSQIDRINDYIRAQGEEKIFTDKIIFLNFKTLSEMRSHVSNISSRLRPSYTEEKTIEPETEETE